MYLGVKAVLAKSIERIHRANLINFGIVPIIFDNAKDYDSLKAADKIEFPGIRKAIEGDGKITVKALGKSFTATASLSDREKELILAGGLLASLK
jgi:aconitate hydratase